MTPAMAQLYATRLQRLLVPSIMPAGLDPHQIIAERDRYIVARIWNRIKELSNLPSTMSEGGFKNPLADGLAENDKERKARLDARRRPRSNPKSNVIRCLRYVTFMWAVFAASRILQELSISAFRSCLPSSFNATCQPHPQDPATSESL